MPARPPAYGSCRLSGRIRPPGRRTTIVCTEPWDTGDYEMNQQLSDTNIAFVGAGSMAEAIVRGLVTKRLADPRRITVINRANRDRLMELSEKYGVEPALEADKKDAAVAAADVIVLAMKPKDAVAALNNLKPHLSPRQLIVSVIAGLSIASIQHVLGRLPVVRTMPNTSCSVGLGATGFASSPEVTAAQEALAAAMFESVGIICKVEEPLLDVVTGLSGSGPAYVYLMMEQMIRAGVESGLDAENAKALTVQTVLGAAEMVRSTGEEPGELRRKVTSPNGTTQAALELLDREGFPSAVRRAVLRAAERARELGAETDPARKPPSA